jgi:hypothetical protein
MKSCQPIGGSSKRISEGYVLAAGGSETLSHSRREEVRLKEVATDRRAPVLQAYVKRASAARAHLPIDKDAPLAEFKQVSPSTPYSGLY